MGVTPFSERPPCLKSASVTNTSRRRHAGLDHPFILNDSVALTTAKESHLEPFGAAAAS